MRVIHWFLAWAGRSLRRKLLISAIPIILISLLSLGYLSFRVARRSIQYEVNQRNAQLATLVARNIKVEVDNIWGNVRLLGHQLDASGDTLSLLARTMLELRLDAPLTYRALYLFDQDGNLLIRLDDRLEVLVEIKNIQKVLERNSKGVPDNVITVLRAAQNGRLYISPPQVVGVDRVPVNYMGIPILDESGTPTQIMVAEIDLRDIWRRIDEIQIGQTGRGFVVSPNGIIIAHPDRVYVGQILPPALAPVTDGFEGRTQYRDPISGEMMLAAYSPVGGQANWGIVVEQEAKEAFAQVNNIALVTIVVLLVAATMGTIAIIITARSIISPIQILANTTQTIAQTGDLSHDVRISGEDEVDQLAHSFNQMIDGLRNAQTRLLKAEATAQELRIAQQIQSNLLLQDYQLLPEIDVAAKTIPAREVGGDFYAMYNLPPPPQETSNAFALAVGDVSGKGLPGALYMAVTSSILAAKAQSIPDVIRLYEELNSLLYPRMSSNRMNTALAYIYLSQQSPWQAHIVNAGLISPLLRRGQTCDYLDIGGLPLGVLPDPPPYPKIELKLEPDDWLVLCSDGIIEAMSEDRELYGFDRLQARVAAFAAEQAYDLIDWILKDVLAFAGEHDPHDDMTIVVLKFKG